MTYAEQRVLDGDVPYRDFWTLYAPGQFYSLALVFKLFGSSLLTARLWDVAIRVALVVAVFGVTRLFVRGVATFVPPLLVLLWLGSVNFPNYPMFPALVCSLTGIVLFCRYLANGRRAWLALSGASIGLAAIYRHDVGTYTIASAAAVIVLSTPGWSSRRVDGWAGPAGSALTSLAAFLAGLAAATVPLVVYVVSSVSPDDLWADLFVYPIQIAPTVRGRPSPALVPNVLELLRGGPELAYFLVSWVPFYLPLAVYALWMTGAAYRVLTGPRVGSDRVRRWGLTLLLLLGLSLLGQLRIIPDWPHLLPTTIVAAILLIGGLQSIATPTVAAWSRRLAVLLVPLVAMPYLLLPAIPGLLATHALWSQPCPWMTDRAGCADLPPDLVEAVEFVRSQVEPSRPIFVGNTRHDRMPGNAMLFYFLADRPSATRYHHLEPGVTTTPSVQAEIVDALERAEVTHLVLFSGYEMRTDWYRADAEAGSTVLDDFIRTRYRPAATFGHYSIWQRT